MLYCLFLLPDAHNMETYLMRNIDNMEGNMPKISVIMGIYNCAGTLSEAINCILNQTEKNWELILCDDGSTDQTYNIALRYKKKYPNKIVVLRNKRNLGLNATLNKCLAVAKGQYIARMDGDDRCTENRFSKEMEVLENNPKIAIVSSDMEFFDENGIWGYISHPTRPTKKDLLRGTPFCHAPCMVRKEAYDEVNGYTVKKRLLRVEDYHLWLKMYTKGFRGENIHEPLYQMRDDRNAYSRRKFRYRINEAYVKYLIVRKLNFPIWNYCYVLRPILVGILPKRIYDFLHRTRLKKQEKGI